MDTLFDPIDFTGIALADWGVVYRVVDFREYPRMAGSTIARLLLCSSDDYSAANAGTNPPGDNL